MPELFKPDADALMDTSAPARDGRIEARITKARWAAQHYGFEVEYDEDSLLADIVMDREVAGSLVHRYLLLAAENAGEGPGTNGRFFSTKAEAKKQMGEYARQGWSSLLYDLDSESDETVAERDPR